jgi:hypothetical protein
MTFDIPILLLGYNRPDLFEKTLKRILEIRPKNFYISLDGPNLNKLNDIEKCQKVRELVEGIDTQSTNLHLRINEVNLGCKDSPKSAIDWFFEEVEYGIILEDDCFPSISFFSFCEVMLKKYINDDRISHISGSNFQYGIWRGLSSYYFSKYTHIWGWASWRRAWKDYDISMSQFEKSPIFLKNKYNLPFSLMQDVYEGTDDVWDIQWFYTNFLHGRLTIIPNINLVKNMGFDDNATHTFGRVYSYIKFSKTGDLLFPLSHPYFCKANYFADQLVSYKVFSNKFYNYFYNKVFNYLFFVNRVISKIKYKIYHGNLFRINIL